MPRDRRRISPEGQPSRASTAFSPIAPGRTRPSSPTRGSQPEPGDTRREREQTGDRDTSEERRPPRLLYVAGEPAFTDSTHATSIFDDRNPVALARREALAAARRHAAMYREHTRLYRNAMGVPDDGGDDDNDSRDSSSGQPSRDLQRRFSREPPPRHMPTFIPMNFSGTTTLPPLRLITNPRASDHVSSPGGPGGLPPRERQERTERTTQRYRVPEQRQPNATALDGLEYDLDDANTQLRALLEYTNTSITSPLSPSLHVHTAQHDQAEDNRRAKRRKLDCDRPGSAFKGFRYGRFGQVEPGQLKMEIHSCDGGVYEDNAANPPENILMNNDGVYCSKKDSCNIVLRHQGATVFTLTELVIRAPGPKFSAPVREGLVFVSMATDELFTRTAQYKVKYVLAPEPRDSTAERDLAPILSVRHNEDGTTITRLHQQPSLARFELQYKTAVFPAEPLPFPVTIATDCSDPEDNVRAPRLRGLPPDMIGMIPFESDSSEDEENNVNAWDDIRFDDWQDSTQRLTDWRSATQPPSTFFRRSHGLTLAEAAEASQLATQEAVQAVGGKLLRPHAKFFIEKGKNRCTIKFDPPVTGRFILLKMYHPSDNIDIQGVYAKGFAGPRYFPSLELR